MGRVYVMTFKDASVAAAQDLFEFIPATNKPVYVNALTLGNSEDEGTAPEEILRFSLTRGHTTSGNGTAHTPKPMQQDAAAGLSAKVNGTTLASAGTVIDLHADVFNNRNGYQFVWPREDRPMVTGAFYVTVRLAAPASAQRMSGTLIVEEIG